MTGETATRIAALGGDPESAAWRAWRWMARLPGRRIAFAAVDDAGWVRLHREGTLITMLYGHVPFAVPEVLEEDEAARVQVRQTIDGISGDAVEELAFGRPDPIGPADRYGELALTEAGRRLADDHGAVIAALQTAFPVDDLAALGLPVADYLGMIDAIDAALVTRDELADLRGALPSLRRWFAALPEAPVLAMRDLQRHNLAVDPTTGSLVGLFDFDDAAIAHRLEDFKYLPSWGLELTRRAIAAHADATGAAVELADVGRFHVLSALEHFLFVDDATPRWPQIVTWTRAALAAFG